MSVSVLWFRRDLRLADHPALTAAANVGPVVPLYVIDPALYAVSGQPRQAFLIESLRSLDASIGGRLVLRHGAPSEVVAQFAREVGASQVFVTDDFGPYGRERDAVVRAGLASFGCRLTAVGSPYAVRPGSVCKDDGSAYSVFTPFSRRWMATGWTRPLPVPDVEWRGAPEVPCDGYPAEPPTSIDMSAGSERAAWLQWERFSHGALHRYDTARDTPGVDGTSRLSAALRWGLMHPRQLLADLSDSRPHTVFRSELAWRDFYADVLYRLPATARWNLKASMNGLPVDTDTAAHARFAQWSAGMTGYPIVDAGMRQLLATGWMHNRVRMIVASFLVKDLHVPWQWGARHFMRHLLDGDLASNSHGWQWTAGTGTDASPYFRVFNPVSQGERFDSDGDYLRRWVPELADASAASIHAPWLSKRGIPLGYRPPMVDHAAERVEALRRYALVSRPDSVPAG